MKSENVDEKERAVRHDAIAIKEAYLCFAKAAGGDLIVEPGDRVTVIVDKGGKRRKQ